jgi:hypothetical protein
MDKKNTEALMASIAALSESLTAFTKNIDGKPDGEKKPDAEDKPVELSAERFAALEAEIKDLKSSITANNEGQDKTSTVDAEAFNKLQTQFEDLAKQFKSALAEQPGTDAGDHVSDGEDDSVYIG